MQYEILSLSFQLSFASMLYLGKDNNFLHEIQVPTSSGSADHTEAASSSDHNDNGTTLGDVLNWVKDTTFASIEELQKLAGGADLKVHPSSVCCYLF